ncbi:hypothetical protein C8J57DRAFT_1628583 [Mycena rebaudengoi]|nr:hypothetical protein C8J57DRAFT_1628583 [Mycena rebaudengoi]
MDKDERRLGEETNAARGAKAAHHTRHHPRDLSRQPVNESLAPHDASISSEIRSPPLTPNLAPAQSRLRAVTSAARYPRATWAALSTSIAEGGAIRHPPSTAATQRTEKKKRRASADSSPSACTACATTGTADEAKGDGKYRQRWVPPPKHHHSDSSMFRAYVFHAMAQSPGREMRIVADADTRVEDGSCSRMRMVLLTRWLLTPVAPGSRRCAAQ